jgi:hypothetical protein
MSASLASISKLLRESAKKSVKGHFGECKYSPKIGFFLPVLALAKFAREWPLLGLDSFSNF